MSKPSDADLDKLKPHLFLFKDPATTKLADVAHDATLDAVFTPIFASTQLKPLFEGVSFAMLNFKPATTQAYFLRPDVNWDIGSAGKLAILAAATTLRNDMRALKGAGLIDATNADDLMRYVWTRHSRAEIKKLSNPNNYPQPSMLFDFSGAQPEFDGGGQPVDFDFLKVLAPKTIERDNLGGIPFRDRLHLAIGRSDNRAARSAQGQLGIAYIQAVVEQLGLYDVKKGIGLRTAGPYSPKHYELPEGWRHPASISRASGKGAGGETASIPYSATARSLARLMESIVRNTFPGSDGPAVMKDFLLWRRTPPPPFSANSFALDGVKFARSSTDEPTTAFSKLGIYLANAEFLYAEYGAIKFGFIMLGVLPAKVGGVYLNSANRARVIANTLYLVVKDL